MIIIYRARILNNARSFVFIISSNSTVSQAMLIVVNEAWLS